MREENRCLHFMILWVQRSLYMMPPSPAGQPRLVHIVAKRSQSGQEDRPQYTASDFKFLILSDLLPAHRPNQITCPSLDSVMELIHIFIGGTAKNIYIFFKSTTATKNERVTCSLLHCKGYKLTQNAYFLQTMDSYILCAPFLLLSRLVQISSGKNSRALWCTIF